MSLFLSQKPLLELLCLWIANSEFLTYFPSTEVEAAKAKIASENKLNLEEFDPSLGAPINLAPKA